MKILALGTVLEDIETAEQIEGRDAIFLTDSRHASQAMKLAGIVYDGEVNMMEIGFSRIETQQECVAGALYIPKHLDVLGRRYKILFFVNQHNIVLVDDDDYARRIIMKIRQRKTKQGESRAHFLYNFIMQVMLRDLELLGRYEQLLMSMEEKVMDGKTEGFQSKIQPIRKELLTLRGYYDEMMDVGKELEENENHFFTKKQLKYFGAVTDRADRLMGKTAHLLEYAGQVRDAYQSQVDAEQNKNMQFLTLISTIFFPLTLITGWYGMNFENMPELQNGYPGVIGLSLIVIGICIFVFKKKKIL